MIAPSGSRKNTKAMEWWMVKIPEETNIARHLPFTNCSILEVMNHRKTYSSSTELMNTQNTIAAANFHGTVKPTGYRIDFKASGLPLRSAKDLLAPQSQETKSESQPAPKPDLTLK